MAIYRTLKLPACLALLLLTTFSTSPAADRAKPKITLSKETTYVTAPLREDGSLDFVAALNQHCSKGVTPDNNAAIPFWLAVGPKEINKNIRKRYFEMLDIGELPEKGEYLVPLREFLPFYEGTKPPEKDSPEGMAWADEAEKQLELARKTPWAREKYPVVAAVLQYNAKPLATFVEAANRARYYSPLVPTDNRNRMTSVLGQSDVANSRCLVRYLTARAMLRIHEGDVAGAAEDIMACDRWGRLNSQGPLLLDHLLGTTYRRDASDAIVSLAHSGKLTSDQSGAILTELRRPPEAVPVIESIGFGERLFGLGILWDIAANGSRWFETDLASTVPLNIPLLFGFDESQVKLFRRLTDDPNIDWDEAFRCENKCYDRIIAACKTPVLAKRRESLAALDKEWSALAKGAVAESAASLPADLKLASRDRARQLSHLMTGSMATASAVLNVESNQQTGRNLAILALALGSYHSDHGAYPATLTGLTPKYLAEIPKDAFTDADLHYQCDGNTYLLYSVGLNGKDDGGRNYLADHNYNPPDNDSATEAEQSTDDIAIRTPPKINAPK